MASRPISVKPDSGPSAAPNLELREDTLVSNTNDDIHHEKIAPSHPLAQLSTVRKDVLLAIFSIATFTDICNVSGVAVAVAEISQDIHLAASQVAWVGQLKPNTSPMERTLTFRSDHHVLFHLFRGVLTVRWPTL